MKKYFKFRPLFVHHSLFYVILFILSGCISSHPLDINKQQAAKARVDLAIGYLNQQDFVHAKLNLDKAKEHAENYYLVHSAFAYFYQKQGDNVQARHAYLTAIRLDDKQGDVRNNYGTFLCHQGEFDSAYSQFQHALNMPNYYKQQDTLENIILCAYSQHNSDLATKTLQQLEKIAPERAQNLRLFRVVAQ